MSAIPSLFETVRARLRLGPATALSLARWCNLHIAFMTRMLEAWRRERKLRCVAGRYELPRGPFEIAGRISVRGYRWAPRALLTAVAAA